MTGVLLVGGASTRFGSPKALARFRGETLGERAWRILGEACDERLAVGKAADGLALPFPLVDDGSEVRAALTGIVAGVRAAAHEVVVVLPVDCPLVDAAAVRTLAGACRDVAVSPTGPLPGAFRRSVLPLLERRLAAGELRLRDAVAGLDAAVAPLDPALLANVNEPDDLEQLERVRPLYQESAWVYDTLFARNAPAVVDGFVALARAGGMKEGATVVDAGCGAGVHARELARRGFRVIGVDRSPQLLARAASRAVGGERLICADLRDLEVGEPADAILCRGVLNDVVGDSDRDRVLGRFRRTLGPGGVLVLDVRDWAISRRHYEAAPHSRREATVDGRSVLLESATVVDEAGRRLIVDETISVDAEPTSRHRFVMRCWTEEELRERLARAGFGRVSLRGDYPGAPFPNGDRLVATAST